jgi:hypothetical protein
LGGSRSCQRSTPKISLSIDRLSFDQSYTLSFLIFVYWQMNLILSIPKCFPFVYLVPHFHSETMPRNTTTTLDWLGTQTRGWFCRTFNRKSHSWKVPWNATTTHNTLWVLTQSQFVHLWRYFFWQEQDPKKWMNVCFFLNFGWF